jgi:hypothetical protein
MTPTELVLILVVRRNIPQPARIRLEQFHGALNEWIGGRVGLLLFGRRAVLRRGCGVSGIAMRREHQSNAAAYDFRQGRFNAIEIHRPEATVPRKLLAIGKTGDEATLGIKGKFRGRRRAICGDARKPLESLLPNGFK